MSTPAAEPREDYLNEDPEIPGQKFCLLSFLSPEKVLANKDIFMFEKFLQTFEYTFSTKNFEAFLMTTLKGVNDKLNAAADEADAKDLSGNAEVLRGSRVRMDTVMDSLKDFVKTNQAELKGSKLKDTYDDFIYGNREKLEEAFYIQNEFRTTVRGMKVRGVYNSREEAVARSKKLQRTDTIHNIFVGEVGKWLPWDPEPSQVGEQEYAEEKLNTLMKKYKENEDSREMFERENRSKMMQGKKAKTEEERVEADANAALDKAVVTDVTPAPSAGSEKAAEYHGMFSSDGPADLAIARKMDREAGNKE
jgi:hypothetical protein